MTDNVPAWAWDLLIASLDYEDVHHSDHPCMTSVLSAVPAEVRYTARAIDEYRRGTQQRDAKKVCEEVAVRSPAVETAPPPAIAPCCGGPHAGWMHTVECTEPLNPLHARFAHPAWEYATTQGQRKAWDRIDEPPEGNGWERNVDAGRPGEGWERFDYREESYWRRLRAAVPQRDVRDEGDGHA